MAANHLDNIVISITLSAAPAPQAGFGSVMVIMDEVNGTTLGGDRTRTYTDIDGATADVTAAELSAAGLAAVTAAFSQSPTPASVKVGRRDSVGLETYPDAYALIKTDDADFYGVCIESRTDADILLMSPIVEAESRVFAFQSDDAAWLTTGLPAALITLDGKERSFGCYHDADTQWMDVAWIAGVLAFDPDVISAPWDRGTAGVNAYSATLNDTQKGFLDSNDMNHGLPYGGVTFFVDAGVNMASRPGYEILTADWFEARLETAIATLKTNASARGEKIIVDERGGAQVLAEIEALLDIGVAAGHFVAGQTSATQLAVTAADRTAQRIRFSVQAQDAVSARIFSFTVNLSRDPISA